ncbi:MAG TPA: VOC family protein, partial [Deinococcales bacterium]|nr:VOC family protein [Deinococcales bacterium]
MSLPRLDHVGINVTDLPAAIAFFEALGLTVAGRDSVSGAWVDRIIGLQDARSDIVFLRTPDGHGQLELVSFQHPQPVEGGASGPSNALGIRH